MPPRHAGAVSFAGQAAGLARVSHGEQQPERGTERSADGDAEQQIVEDPADAESNQ